MIGRNHHVGEHLLLTRAFDRLAHHRPGTFCMSRIVNQSRRMQTLPGRIMRKSG
jgi:hypothetical protein